MIKQIIADQTSLQAAPLVREETACEYLNIKPRTLRLWRRCKGLPHYKLTRKEIRYRISDIAQWAERCRVATVERRAA